MGLAVLLVALEGGHLVLLGSVSHLAVVLVHLGAHLVEGFFLVLVALEHFLGLIHVFLGDLLWGADSRVGDAGGFVLLSLVHDHCLNAFEQGLFVHGLAMVLGGNQLVHNLRSHILIH